MSVEFNDSIKYDDYMEMKKNYERWIDNYKEEARYYHVALNLAENREELEDKALDLANKHGMLQALIMTREPKEVSHE